VEACLGKIWVGQNDADSSAILADLKMLVVEMVLADAASVPSHTALARGMHVPGLGGHEPKWVGRVVRRATEV
jgi:hypothetical protein